MCSCDCYRTSFTGHSGDDFKRIFNAEKDDWGQVIIKPQIWKDRFIIYNPLVGMDYVEKA